MSEDEAHAAIHPSSTANDPDTDGAILRYRNTAANSIGEFPIDLVELRFFDGRLYRIDLRISKFPSQIFEALKVNYGGPYDNNGWKRGEVELQAKSWQGEKISATILGLTEMFWDLVIIYNIERSRSAKDYAAKGPERAARDLEQSGFKMLVFGSSLQSLSVKHRIANEDRLSAIKTVEFEKADWQSIGSYKLTKVSANYFKEKLYRIDLEFESHGDEIVETVRQRFGELKDDETWTAGTLPLKAKSVSSEKTSASILQHPKRFSNFGEWDTLVLSDRELWSEASQFKRVFAELSG